MGTLIRSFATIAAGALLLQASAAAQGPLEVFDTQYLVAPDINPYQEFGTSLDVDGDTLIVGSPYDEDYGLQSGSAYVFVRSSGAWVFQQKLHAPVPAQYERFGTSVAVSGDVAVVGVPRRSIPTAQFAFLGSAHVFRRSVGTWTLEAELRASDEALFWHFGEGVDVQGDRIVVGAPQRGSQDSIQSQWDDHGSVYVFDLIGGTWTGTAILRASDGVNDDFFGEHVALSGNTLVAAASGNGSGVGYAFVDDGAGTWSEQAILVPPNLGGGGGWGESLAFEGDVAVAGNWRFVVQPNSNVGRAVVWRRSGSAWSMETVLSPGNGPALTVFGKSVAVHGDRIAVGAPNRSVYGTTGQDGAAWVFVHHAGQWTLEMQARAGTGTNEDAFGNALAWEGNLLVVGAYHRWEWGIRSGAVYDCDLAQRAHTYCQALPNSAGPGAWIGATGTLSVSANDFWLTCGGLPPGSTGKFFYGTGQANAPFGNGLRCVGGSTFRLLPHLFPDAAGSVTRHIDFTQSPTGVGPGTINPGSTWYFQYWHRNAAAGGAGFNLSDGFSATFVP